MITGSGSHPDKYTPCCGIDGYGRKVKVIFMGISWVLIRMGFTLIAGSAFFLAPEITLYIDNVY